MSGAGRGRAVGTHAHWPPPGRPGTALPRFVKNQQSGKRLQFEGRCAMSPNLPQRLNKPFWVQLPPPPPHTELPSPARCEAASPPPPSAAWHAVGAQERSGDLLSKLRLVFPVYKTGCLQLPGAAGRTPGGLRGRREQASNGWRNPGGPAVRSHLPMPPTRGFRGPYFSRAFLNGVGVWGALSMEYF